MSGPTPVEVVRNAAIELCDHLPGAYRTPVHIATAELYAVLAQAAHPDACCQVLARLLDEITDALGVQARLGAGG